MITQIKCQISPIKSVVLFLIKVYQKVFGFLPRSCRFYPSCSEYAKEAISYYGIFKGSFYSLRRLLRCHPFNPGGYDPVRNLENFGSCDKKFHISRQLSEISNGVNPVR